MSIENVREYLKQFNLQDKVIELKEETGTVEQAALALGCEGKQIAKTMAFNVNDGAVLVLLAGDTKVDNSKFKAFFGVKAKMLTAEELDNFVGHKMGGVCPFAIKENVKVYLDESLKRFNTVFPACGSSNSAIELTNDELQKYSSNFVNWIDVCKLPE